MKYSSFSDLYFSDFELTDLFAMRQKWSKGVIFEMENPRKSTGLIYLNSCYGKYTDVYGKSFSAKPGDLICLPYQSRYVCENCECENSVDNAFLVEFNVVSDGEILTFSDSPFKVNTVGRLSALGFAEKSVFVYESARYCAAKMKSVLYDFISEIGKENNPAFDTKFYSITDGIKMLEENPLSEISIEEIAHRCNVSSGCFRRLFKEYSGMSPNDYRMKIKINMAENMLRNSNMSIEKIAESLSMFSGSYLSKIFKNKTGLTPGQYRKMKQ